MQEGFLQLKNVLWQRGEIKTKLWFSQASIIPVLLSGCKSCPLRLEDIHKANAFDYWRLERKKDG